MFSETCYTLIWSSGVVCLSTFIFNVLRNHVFVTVNCWFCNTNFRIPFKVRKEWFCRQCNQFNGFRADGDYSRIIPEQFDEALNRKYVKPAFWQREHVFSSNGLCSICNANQELKIKQLALYVPFKEENYDEEIEIFRNKLEKSYKLCQKCENFVLEKLPPKSNAQQCTNDLKVDETNTVRCSSISEYHMTLKMLVIFIVVIGTLTAFIFKTKFLEESIADMLIYYDVEQVFLRGPLQFYGDLVLDYIFPLSTAFLPCLFFKNSRSIVAILLVIFSSMITRDLVSFWKVFAISAVLIAIVIRYFANNGVKKRRTFQMLDFSLQKSFDWEAKEDEEDKYQKKVSATQLNSSTNLYGDTPLCGQFSDMHLDKCDKYFTYLPRQSSPPSFRCDRLLIQPSKLKIDDFVSTDTLRTSPTVSSGYQSLCSGFFKKASDSDSEFDSISQIHIASTNHSFSNIPKSHTSLPRFTKQSRFPSTNALNLSNAECYYGAIPVYSSTSARLSSSPLPDFSMEKSHLQVDANISTFQIVLYSITCFVLGFSFQIFVRDFFF